MDILYYGNSYNIQMQLIITLCTILQEARTEVLQDMRPVRYSKHWCTN